MSSSLQSKNVVVEGQRTSFRLEPEMWAALDLICSKENINLHKLCTLISTYQGRANRTSAIRAFIVSYLRASLEETSAPKCPRDECLCSGMALSNRLCALLTPPDEPAQKVYSAEL